MLTPPERMDEESGNLERIRRGAHVESYETICRRKDGTLLDVSLAISPIMDSRGNIIGAARIARDITERLRAEEQRQLLLNEMNHRVKNLFAVMGGVIALSARSADSPQAMAKTVTGRLIALSHAHKLIAPALSGKNMTKQRATLDELVRATLAPYLDAASPDDDPRTVIRGPEVAIGGEAVTALALILHELATNAAKYGAFSSPKGRVHVAWSVNKGKLALSWRETGGPPVKAAPKREGFGSRLAQRSAGQLGGQLAFEWNAEGVIVRLSAAAERLVP
jgi:two-component sensor histidine kinase